MGKYKGRRRNMPYKVDSTKGGSELNPASYKGDALVQVWMDSRWLATLSRWLDKQGGYTRYLSEIVNDSIKVLVEHLVENGEVEMVDDTVEARSILEMKYRVNLNPAGKGLKNKLHNIILSDKRKSLRGRMELKADHSTVDVPMGKNIDIGADVARGVKIYRGLEEKEAEDAKAESREKLSALIDSGQVQGLVTEKTLADERKLKDMKKEDKEYIKELKEAGPRDNMIVKE